MSTSSAPWRLASVLVAGLLLSACARPGPLGDWYAEVTADLETAAAMDDFAKDCAPAEYALANAHKEFAEIEFEQGDTRRAEYHLKLARTNARLAAEKAQACQPQDRDGDGIMDDVDQCPDEAEVFNGVEDEDGCPESDRDGDKIFDSADQCPDNPEDMDGWQDEDGCPEMDNDADGIVDTADQCPNEPEDFNGFQDTDGCPEGETDRDGDGIRDDMDACPDEPENINEYLDEDGCPDVKPQNVRITKEKIEISEKILFATGKDRILSESYGILDSVAQVMRDYPKMKIRIEGHTDSDGSESYNLNLSTRRAQAVYTYLVDKGLDAGRMTSQGFGEASPIDTNRTSAGKANNRRVEFVIVEWQ